MDAAAVGWLGLKGVAVAAVPLAYVFFSHDPAKFRKLAWATAFLTLDLSMVGSFTRLTDSGLGCDDWPACNSHSLIDVSSRHAAIEQVNRLFTGLVSAAVIAAVLGSLVRSPRRKDLVWLSCGLVVGEQYANERHDQWRSLG